MRRCIKSCREYARLSRQGWCPDRAIDEKKKVSIYTKGIQKVLRQILKKKNSEYGNQIR